MAVKVMVKGLSNSHFVCRIIEKMRIALLTTSKIGHFCSKSQICGKMDDGRLYKPLLWHPALTTPSGQGVFRCALMLKRHQCLH